MIPANPGESSTVPRRSKSSDPTNESRASSEAGYWIAVGAIFTAAFLIRAVPVLPADFPLNDGGLISVMVEEVRKTKYGLPFSITYNSTEIPFAYPPLAFYAAALLTDLTPATPLDVLRVLPMVVNTLTVGAFFLLARSALPPRAALVATGIFAILPGSFLWLIMGGGVTRSFGLLFAILALRQVYVLCMSGGLRPAALLGIFAALTLLSHIALFWFLAYSAVLVGLGFCRDRRRLLSAAAAGAAAVAIASPWWVTVLVRYGPGPFLAAFQAGSFLTDVAAQETAAMPAPALLAASLVALVALFLGMATVGDQRFFVLGWLGSMLLLDTRSFRWLVTLPLALADGALLDRGVLPRLGRLWRQAAPSPSGVAIADRAVTAVTVGVVVALSVIIAYAQWEITGELLVPLSIEERNAMRWISEETPETSTFLVLSGQVWAWDRSAEWFPVLARRISVTTAQGYEWLPGGLFRQRQKGHQGARQCAKEDAACLDRWSTSTRVDFSHVYLPRPGSDDCCAPLRESLRSHPTYQVVYDGRRATIFARRS